MNLIWHGKNQNEAIVSGFEVPKSPDASYDNVYPEDDVAKLEPPIIPQNLHHTVLNSPAGRDLPESLPLPQNVILNHVYQENRETEGSVMAVGVTHRFRSKYVTAVLYKAVHGIGCTSS